MITTNTISRVKEMAYTDSRENGAPSIFQIDYATEVAIRLADLLGADRRICQTGAYLMDCALGTAYRRGVLDQHVAMSHKKAEDFLNSVVDVTEADRKNILNCVLEHHGVGKFSSLESEIVCNADCYKFLSVKGVVGGIMHMRDMEVDQVVQIFEAKAVEKWGALSLDVCKQELKNQYENISGFLGSYTGE